MQEPDPPRFASRRSALRERLETAPGLVLALDFDGTLAPIVESPDDATMDEDLREILAALARRPAIEPAVVSGRELADLRERVGVHGIAYAGNHGLELHVDDERVVPEPARQFRAAIDAVCADLAERLADVSGIEIEHKGLTATVHVRRVPADRRPAVERAVRDAVAERNASLEVTDGKAIREIRPPIEWDKGTAVERLDERTPEEWLTVYVGDDVTDEDAFETLAAMDADTLTVVVGDREETAADYRLTAQSRVREMLAVVARSRGIEVSG